MTMLDQDTRRDYWLCQLAGWGAMLVIAILSSSSSGEFESSLRFAAAKSFCIVTGLGLSHAWHRVLKRRNWFYRAADMPIRRILAGLLLLAVLQTGALLLADLLFRDGRLMRDDSTSAVDYTLLVMLWFGVFAVWTLCYAMALMRRRALHAELEKLQLEVSVKDAELRALQFQVNPHFFFNSLNSIRALIYADPPAAADAVSQLAGMMRQRLQAGPGGTVALGTEMASVSAYLAIEKLRFDERLQVSIDIDPALADTPVPPMAVQTLVENAIKHGVERMTAPCQVAISARLGADGMVQVVIRNQGRLAVSSGSTRLGLSNTIRRLALQCGPLASCVLAEEDGWVRATLAVPQGES
jgi:hypothetical protein